MKYGAIDLHSNNSVIVVSDAAVIATRSRGQMQTVRVDDHFPESGHRLDLFHPQKIMPWCVAELISDRHGSTSRHGQRPRGNARTARRSCGRGLPP